MNKSLIIFMVLSSLLLSGITFAAYDITSPGDTLVGVPDDGDWPAGEAPPYVIDDNINTKYLHFGGDLVTTGFQVTPSRNGVVTGLSFTTANDAPERDPVHFELYGSNDGIDGPYTLIADGDVLDFSQPDPWPRYTRNETPISFSNTEVYTHYQVLITAVRTPGNGCCMQVAEVELLVETPPTPWVYRDIGTTGGHAWEEAGTYNVRADGADIWGNSDQFGYVFRPVSGDVEFEVDLTSITDPPPNEWTKVGVMIRETSDAGSKHAMVAVTGAHGLQFVYRNSTGGGSAAPDTILATPPQKLKIVRIKDFEPGLDKLQGLYWNVVIPGVFEYWESVGDVNMPTTNDVLVGLCVTSHNSGQLCYAQYNNVTWPAGPYEKPWDMKPADGSTKVPLNPTLSWLPGDSATSHDVYIGTDPGAMSLAATVTDLSYTPITPLAEVTMYYWQIVEQPLGIAGPVYSFKTERVGNYGKILREVWEGIGGTLPRDLYASPDYPCCPSWSDEPTSMASYDFADNYGARMQGYLVPETSGDYTFWIAADDGCELWLSTDERSCNAVRIAYHNAWTGAHNWFWYAEQQSAPVSLVANQKYFIRAVWKEGGGGDNCQVAWYGPDQPSWPVDGSNSAVIGGYFLMPADDPYASFPNPADGDTVTPLEAAEVSWKPGKNAVAHNVYYGSDPGAMALVGTVPMPDTSIVLPPTAAGQTIYWSVEADDGTQTYPLCAPWSMNVQEWVSVDIGRSNPEPPGSASYDEATGVYTLKATGTFELWGQADEFHYLYTTMEMTRDTGSIKARVLGIEQPNEWRRAGVMIRETTAPNSRKVMAHKTGHDNTRMQWREQPSYDTWNTADNWGLGYPLWVRVDRDGEQFNGYYSYDNENWVHLGGMWCPMPSGKYVCIGLALCHHPNVPFGEFTIGRFDNLSIWTPDPRASWSPSPGNGAENVPLDVTLSWNAGDDAVQHLLYISESREDVLYGLVDPVILPAETTEYHVGKLNLNSVNYWAVDEVRREGRDMATTLGDIWSFKVEPYRLIDDFEGYCITPDPLPPQVEVPGEVILEAVPPPDQAWVEPQVLLEAVPPDAGCLIAEWAFEGNYDDTSGSGFNGTPMGDATIVVDAERGNVLSLDGDMDYVDCGNPAALNFSTGDWSLSAWIKNTMSGGGDENKGNIISNGADGGGGIRYALGVSEQTEGLMSLTTDDNDSNGIGSSYNKKQITAATATNDDTWHHVLGVREGDTIRIYTDGKLESSTNIGGADYDLSGTVQANVLIGALTKASDMSIYKDYAGLIDDVQIYNCALTEGNARYLAGIGDLLKDGYYGPCIVHYAFDEGAGDVATDSSGNGLDGAISGAAWTAVTADGSAACLDFDGLGGNVLNTVIGPYLNNLDALSISLWVQSDLIDTDKGFIMLGDSASDRWGARYDAAGGDGGGDDVIKYGVNTTGGNEEDESSPLLQTTEWQHLVITWESGIGLKLWVNGVIDVPSSDKGPVSGVLTGYTKIQVAKGSKDSAADASWDGRIDDVRIYDKALSEGEVRYLAGIGDLLAPPGYEPLVACYEFEGNYDDSSGNNRTATPIGAGISIETDPVMGQVLSLPGGTNDESSIFVEVGSVGISGNDPTTIACWAKADHTSIPDWTLIFGFTGTDTGAGGDGSHFNIGSLGGPGGVGAHIWGWEATIFSDTEALDWRHYAMTWDGTILAYYGDGKLVRAFDPVAAGESDLSIRADRVHIGSRVTQNSSFYGDVDDARVYNIALTPEQISGLAGCDNPIEDTWKAAGSCALALDYETAHEGAQSLRLEYGGFGSATCATPFDDWTSGNAKALTLYFKGDPANILRNNPLRVALTARDSTGAYRFVSIPWEGDLDALLSPDWTEWNIDMDMIDGDEVKHITVSLNGDAGKMYFDDFRLYPSRCIPTLSSVSDLNQDCFVNGKDLHLLLGEWLAEEQVQDWEYRAAYYDARYPTGWADTPVAEGVRDYLSAAGYTVLDANELKTWMDARIADGALSVVVMCQDIAPDTVAETRDASCTLRRYLNAGGKVVQYADIPFYNQGHADGTTTNWATDGSVYILGFNAAGAAWDSGNTVTITAAGANWGLTTPWPSNRPARAMDVDTILATDNDGDASGWAKHYVGGDNYRGFVYIADFDPDSSVVPLLGPALLSVAEYKGALLYDLYEDGANNFMDYSVLTNDWLEHIVWP
jgi:hypothetical protein